MLTNWKTISQSIKRMRDIEATMESEDLSKLSKKEALMMSRDHAKLMRTLNGIRDMGGLPDLIFVLDTNKEHLAVAEAKVLGIPVVAVIDSNSNPDNITFPVPGNDDALRAIDLYCTAVANACIEGSEAHQAELVAQRASQPAKSKSEGGSSTGRRVVEIKQQPRRGRNQGERTAGGGKSYSAGGEKNEDKTSAAAAPPTAPPTHTPTAVPRQPLGAATSSLHGSPASRTHQCQSAHAGSRRPAPAAAVI